MLQFFANTLNVIVDVYSPTTLLKHSCLLHCQYTIIYLLSYFLYIQDSDDEVPDLVEGAEDKDDEKGSSRGEKKARKALSKLGLKPIPGVERVTIKKSKYMMFVIADADVFKSPSSNTYVIFGEAKIEDLKQKEMAAQQNMQRQERYNSQAAANQYTAANKATAQTSASDEVVDETGVDPKDIELVVSQANCSRADAVRALKKNDNDIVNAIMELTI